MLRYSHALRLGDHHRTAGAAIQPMDDAVAFFSAQCREGDPLVFEPVDEGRLFHAGGGMDGQGTGFVNDENVVVFV